MIFKTLFLEKPIKILFGFQLTVHNGGHSLVRFAVTQCNDLFVCCDDPEMNL